MPDDWQARFLDFLMRNGVRWRAARYAGVAYDTVARAERADPRFAEKVEAARQEFADSQEMQLATLGRQGNVVGPIVLLKKHRPQEFVERALTVTANFSTQLDPAAGQALLQTMLGHLPQPLAPQLPDVGILPVRPDPAK